MRNCWKLLLVGGPILLLSPLLFWEKGGSTSIAADAPFHSDPIVFTLNAEKKHFSDVLVYPARVQSRINANILAEVDGIVDHIAVNLGQAVKKNGLMMILKNTDPVYHYLPLKVLSPVTGVVTSLEVTLGARVTKGQKIASVTDPKQMTIQVEVATNDIPTLTPGLKGKLSAQDSEKSFDVQVVGVSPQIDPVSGTAPCELKLISQGYPLFSGQLGRVTFEISPREGFQIPEKAISYKEGNPFVRTVSVENKVQHKKITLGKIQRGMAEILSGLEEGDQVVLQTSRAVTDGEKVSIQPAETERAE